MAQAGDEPALALLFGEMQAHYQRPVAPEILERAAATLVAPPDGVVAMCGLEEGRILGFGVANRIFPSIRLTEALFLKDLYVSAQARGRGVGRAILAGLAAHARDRGYSRLDWTAEPDNPGAIRLYQSLGAVRAEKIYFRLEGAAMERLAEGH